jgi:threonine/homoserine/homoserine lactone efflux protein
MLIDLFWKGIIIGLSASIPMGPVGVLCMTKTLNKSRFSGFITGSGAAFADGVYAVIAGFGVSFIIHFIVQYQDVLKLLGGAVVIFFGIRLFLTNPAVQLRKQMKSKGKGLWGDFFTSFALTISNPVGLFVFGAVFAGFGLIASETDTWSVLILIGGVLSGAILWWFSLSTLVSIFRDKFRLRRLLWVNRISGIIVMIFGAIILLLVFLPNVKESNLPEEYTIEKE